MKRYLALALLSILVMSGIIHGYAPSVAAAKPAVVEVGVASTGQNGMEYVGRVLQNTTAFEIYGYLTHIDGLSDKVLVSNTDPISHTDASARFTLVGTMNMTARTVISNVTTLISLDSVGQIDFYYNRSPNTNFGDPQSFSQGTKIATFAVRFHSINNVQAPGMGILSGSADLSQTRAASFSIGNRSYRLGRLGMQAHLTGTGEARRLDLAHSVSDIAGDIVLTGQS